MNIAVAASSVRLEPIQPDAGMSTARLTKNPTTTPSTDAAEVWKSLPMVGMAILTMVTSKMLRNRTAT